MTKEEMDKYCESCGDREGYPPCCRKENCEKCKRQDECLPICVMEHMSGRILTEDKR